MHKRLIELTQDTRLPLALTLLSGFAGGLLIIWQASLLSSTIDGVFLKQQTLTDVWPDLRLLVLIFAGRAILAWASEVSANAVAVQIKSKLRERLFVHLGRLGPGFVRGERTGELVAAAQEGVETLDAYYSQYLPQLVISAVVPLSILVFVFPLDPISGLILLLTAPLIPLFMVLIGRAAEGLTQRQYETLGRLSAHFLDSLQGLTTLKQFGRSKAQTKNIAAVSERFRDATLQVMRVTFLSAFALELLATLSVAVIAVEIGLRLLYGQMVFQQALFLLVLAPEFYMPLRMLGQRFHSGMAGTTAARHVFQILDIGEQATGTQSAALTSPRLSSEAPFSSLEFSHVSYTYPGESVPALNDVTMTLHCGQRIALIGSSGGGKSTLATLLLRFAEPSLGQILIDGQPLADVPADLWRLLIAWVPQDPFLFHDTIAANIRLSDPAANPQSVTEAAQAAHLDEFIESLPDRYETVIGEAGARLSGGQAQRLALARAFLRNAPILLLDEPTSSLDLEQEQLLEDSLRKLAGRGRPTIITIAHRLATVMAADQILVLENGAVAENGSPAELLARGGSFAAMVAAFREKTEKAGSQWPSSEGRKRSRTPWDASATQSDQGQGSWDSPSPRTTAGPFVRLLALLRGSLWQVLLSVALGALTIFASVGLMGTSAYLISAAALRPPIASLEIAIVGVRFFGLSRAAFRYLERLVSHGVTLRVLARLRTWFYGALEPLAPARLMQYRSGDLLARIVADVDNLENFYVRAVAPPVVALIVISAVALFLANFDDRLGWAAILFLSLVGIGLPILSRALSSRPARNLVGRRAELTSLLVDGIQGLADLTAFDRLAGWGEQIDAASREAGRAQLRLARVAGVSTALTGLLAGLGMWAVLVIAIGLVRDGDLDGVALASLTLITLASFEAVTPLPQSSQLLISCLESARRLFEVVDVAPSVRESPLPTVAGLTPVAFLRQGIEVKELSFRYSPDGPEALKGVSFSMRPGEALAVIGRNGAGKSTLFNLLLRFWEYQQGEILADGQSIRSIASDQVRQLFAVVSQNSHFFNATVSENLRLGNREATTEQVETAARQAQIHGSLMSLPHGYDTRIGERGARLSGGERQRMAIARALLKSAPVLLLDEPTANLDPQNARALLEMLFDLMREGGRSTLMITHRLWGLEHFDEILVLDEGRIVERGTHAGLLAEGGLYRRFWELENQSF